MGNDMFIRPLDVETVTEIANSFKAFRNTDGIKFERNEKIALGSFSAQIVDAEAFGAMLLYPHFCLVQENGKKIFPNSYITREYLVCVIEVKLGIEAIDVLECDSSTGLAHNIATFAFDKVNTNGSATDSSFIVLVPRKNDERRNKIGIALTRNGTRLRFEFKRDGKTMPVLN